MADHVSVDAFKRLARQARGCKGSSHTQRCRNRTVHFVQLLSSDGVCDHWTHGDFRNMLIQP